ncbi:hypothetical protein FRB95_007407 [Tulasnella sp. JGI-2019a]|nr:hypothetical protein FRB95_007407 [Tulasnella sp. JGI-2019a]
MKSFDKRRGLGKRKPEAMDPEGRTSNSNLNHVRFAHGMTLLWAVTLNFRRHSFNMIRRAASSSSSSPAPPAKRIKLDAPTATRPLNYKDGVMLAPMVRSSTLPSRLLALKYGADLVWGPETVDKAIIGCERAVDERTGVVSYHRGGNAIFTCHPVEKPYLVYQIGSSTPELAAQAASKVCNDVSGIDLNCGCPKPFSTTGGMGAALLSTPDLLCDILKAIRAAVPQEVSVSVKIRLLPKEEDTLDLVRKIVETGAVRCLTVHCRTRNMRMTERAQVERLTSIVKLCQELDPELAVIQNGDCTGRDAGKVVRELTGCDSVMIATAAESNLSCFRGGPLADAASELIPSYARLAYFLGNIWGNSKHCLSQFKSPPAVAPAGASKSAKRQFREVLAKAKTYEGISEHIGGIDGGEEVLASVSSALGARERQPVSDAPSVDEPSTTTDPQYFVPDPPPRSPRNAPHDVFDIESGVGSPLIAV